MNRLIKLDLDSVNRTKSGAILGNIYFDLNGFKFPNSHWSDFVIVIMSWWTEAFNTLLNQNKLNEINFDFMDGPVSIKFHRVVDDVFVLDCVENEVSISNKYLDKDFEVKIDELITEIINVSEDLMTICESYGWLDDDIVILKKELDIMKKHKRKMSTSLKLL